MSSISTTDGGYQYYQRKLSDLESEMRDEAKRSREHYDERADALEKKSTQNVRDYEKKSDEAVNDVRENSSALIDKEREAARADVERARAATYDKHGRAQSEIAFHKKRADEAIRQAQEQLDSQKTKLDRARDLASAKTTQGAAERMRKNADQEHESRARETTELRQSIDSLLENERAYGKEKGQGSADARREIENEARTREFVMRNQYETDLDQLQHKSAQTEHELIRAHQQDMHDRDTQFAKDLHRTTQQHQDDMRTLSESTEHVVNQVRDMARQQAVHAQESMDRQATTMQRDNQESLTRQAETFRHEKQLQREEDQSKIHHLESEIKGHITSGDQSWVSPAAEARMRENFMKEFTKKQEAEVTRNKEKTDSLHKEYAKRLADVVEASDTRIMTAEADHRSSEYLQQQTLSNHIDEIKSTQERMLRDKDYQANRQMESLNHNYSNDLERQRREYEGVINQLKSDHSQKITDVRQQADFNAKMAQRNFASQQYEISKSYERKLEEQKTSYEDALSNLKEQLATHQHEAERRTRQLLDDQAKGYEQKIAQMEYQTKERERTISDNYQDQIEKLKRSNALLIQRKS
jgi:hypothetical protein